MGDIGKIMQGINRASNIHLDRAMALPSLQLPPIPTVEEQNDYQSSGALIRRLAMTVKCWRVSIPAESQPVIIAVMANGAAIRVQKLIQEGHNGIIVEGQLDESPCMMLAHQATVQLLCYVERVEIPEQIREPIGFHYSGQQQDEVGKKSV